MKRRTAAGAARFFVLVPNPDHVGFDRNSPDTADGEALLAKALAQLQAPAESTVSGRVANSPNAYDDIVEELEARSYARDHPRDPTGPYLPLAALRPAA